MSDGPQDDSEGTYFSVYLTVAEKARVDAQAKSLRLSRNALIRRMIADLPDPA